MDLKFDKLSTHWSMAFDVEYSEQRIWRPIRDSRPSSGAPNQVKIVEQKAQWGVNYSMGDTGFLIRKRDFVSAGISWFERWDAIPDLPRPSHAFIIGLRDETIEAFGDGVHTGTISAYLHDPNVALLVRHPTGWTLGLAARICHPASKHIGDRYGYRLILAMALLNTYTGHLIDRLTHGEFGEWIERLGDSKRSEICSQLVAKAMQAQGELTGLGVLSKPP